MIVCDARFCVTRGLRAPAVEMTPRRCADRLGFMQKGGLKFLSPFRHLDGRTRTGFSQGWRSRSARTRVMVSWRGSSCCASLRGARTSGSSIGRKRKSLIERWAGDKLQVGQEWFENPMLKIHKIFYYGAWRACLHQIAVHRATHSRH